MAKSVDFNQIEESKNGTIFMEWRKLSSDGDPLDYHRTSFAPGSDVDAQIAAVNAQLLEMGFESVPAGHVAKIKLFASAAWTPENIAPVTAKVVEAIATQQAAITEAAAKKVEAEAAEAESKAAQESAKLAADAQEAENKRLADALTVAAAAEKAAADQAKFDKAVADAVAAQTQ